MSEPPQDPRQPQPGWYPDPGGKPVLRWWDGTAWAVHTQSLRADHGSVNVGGDVTGDIAAGNAKIDKRRYRFFLPPMLFGPAAKQVATHWVVTTITVVAIGGVSVGVALRHKGPNTPAPSPTTSAVPASTHAALSGSAARLPTPTRIVLFKGGGVTTPVPEPLPPPGGIALSTAPSEIEVADANVTTTLKMDVASLEKPYGDCASGCSDWWVSHNGLVGVDSFSWDQPTGTVTGHGLSVPIGSSNWQDMGNGIYTPLYFEWSWTNTAGTLGYYYCMHLDLPTKEQPKATYDWSLISQSKAPPPNC